MTNTYNKTLLYGIVIAIIFAVVYLMGSFKAEANSVFPATSIQVATTTTVGPQQNIQLFAKNSACSARIISTGSSAIMISFADPSNGDVSSTTLSGVTGNWQAASTTVAYDSGLYGCARWFGYGVASTTVMLNEAR